MTDVATGTDTEGAREALEAEKSRLESRLEAQRARMEAAETGANPSRVETAQSQVNGERQSVLLWQTRSTLELVEAALDRLEAGTYGHCRKCGEPIDAERLDAIPYAELCMNCKQAK
jgi:DnaK suppressor protein